MNKAVIQDLILKAIASVLIGWIFVGASSEFYNIAWGTGNWNGEFSRTWAILFGLFILICSLFIVLSTLYLWRYQALTRLIDSLITFRYSLGNVRWLLSLLCLIFPIWFLQYTPWGVVFQGLYLRIVVWLITASIMAILFSAGNSLASWAACFSALILTASAFSIMSSLKLVSDFPFSLGWSEGNRLWDYSILFGRRLYETSSNEEIPVLLDFGRQIVGGIPFLFPRVTIASERAWVGLTSVIPYLVLGIAAFRTLAAQKRLWFIAALWVFLFLKQGPIHPPLVLAGALVALAWGMPLWGAMPLLIGAGYFVQVSRFTWVFAPSIWIMMLELGSASFLNPKAIARIWSRSLALGIAGLIGVFLLPRFIDIPSRIAQAYEPNAAAVIVPVEATPTELIATQEESAPNPGPSIEGTPTPITYIDSIIQKVNEQPLLWYRLLPNATYGIGILAGLLIATLPLILLLIYLIAVRKWTMNWLQGLAIVGTLLAFLLVGLVASTKIGGGGDLHNLDMFLIALMFTAVIAWHRGGREWSSNINFSPLWIKLVLVLLFAIPGFQPLMAMRSYSFADDLPWMRVLTDAPPKSTLDMLPSQQVTDEALEAIRSEVNLAQSQDGEVLFMDQRQLLTFGYIKDVSLVPEYEKKMLMNEALSANSSYFEPFYANLAAHRFALIVTDPLRTPIKDSSFQFGEENNAWVTWVSNPVLCYYQEKDTFKEVNVQLLIPKSGPVDCSAQLPAP